MKQLPNAVMTPFPSGWLVGTQLLNRPHTETALACGAHTRIHRAGMAVLLFQVAAKVAVSFKVIALMEEVNWQIGRLRR